ncbi:MAG TPA: hypothetical protein PLO05_08590 [Bacteroidales bacterium]|nr:hypothetical protein [Bacteroidales bacterium]HXK82200.1 hypothetical protein [Bacteroidales bacterium]
MKTNKHLLLLIATLAIFTFLFSSCKKIDDTIVGKWDSQLMNTSTSLKVYWTITDDGKIVRERIDTNTSTTQTDNCSYTIDKKLTKTYLIIEGSNSLSGDGDINGKWIVYDFNDDILKIRRVDLSTTDEELTDGAFLVREFIRVN